MFQIRYEREERMFLTSLPPRTRGLLLSPTSSETGPDLQREKEKEKEEREINLKILINSNQFITKIPLFSSGGEGEMG